MTTGSDNPAAVELSVVAFEGMVVGDGNVWLSAWEVNSDVGHCVGDADGVMPGIGLGVEFKFGGQSQRASTQVVPAAHLTRMNSP